MSSYCSLKIKERKGKKYCRELLSWQKNFANSTYQGSAEDIFHLFKKKPLLFIVINEREKKKVYLAFLITSLFPLLDDWIFSLSLMGEWLRDFFKLKIFPSTLLFDRRIINKRRIYVVFYLRKNKGWYMILKILCKFTSIILHIWPYSISRSSPI